MQQITFFENIMERIKIYDKLNKSNNRQLVMASTSRNLAEAEVGSNQFENEHSLINLQQALISEQTPEWQNLCFISPFRLSLNNAVFNPYSSQITKEPALNVCKYHNKNYEYVCCQCRQMQCKLCQCFTSVQQFDIFKAHTTQRDTIWSKSVTGQHRIISLNKFLNLVRKQNKNKVDAKLHQYKIIEQNEKLNKTKVELENKIASIQIQTQSCIEILRRYSERCEEILQNQIRNLQWSTRKKVQVQAQLIEYCQIMKKIMDFDQDSDAIDLMIKKWDKISHQVYLGDISKTTCTQQFNGPNKQNRGSFDVCKAQKSQNFDCNKILQSLRKIQSECQKLQTMNKNDCMDRSLKCNQKNSNCKKGLKQTNKIRSTLQIDRIRLSLASNEVKENYQRERLGGSITNLINRQIIKINKSETKNIKNQIQKILMYGGVHKSSLIQYYYPWRISKSKLIESVKSKQERYEAPSHTGFGLVKLKEKMNSFGLEETQFLIIGGYYNSEMSDCIFRVNCQKKKKELAGRITQPLAYFGFATKTFQKEEGNTLKVYMCGGLDQFKEPVSSFTSMSFSESSELISKNELPALEQPKYSLSLVEHRSNFYAIGGINNQNKVLKTVNKFCPQTQKWIHISDLNYERCHHSSISLRSGLYVIGGWNGQNYLRSVERLQQSRSAFNVVMDMKQARCSFGLIGCPESNGIIIMGGKNAQCLSSCQYLSIKNRSSCCLQPLKSSKSEFFCF